LLVQQAEDVAVVNLLAMETRTIDRFGKLTPIIENIVSFSGQTFIRARDGYGVAVNTLNRRYLPSCAGLKLGLLHCHRAVYPLELDQNDDQWTAQDLCDQCH